MFERLPMATCIVVAIAGLAACPSASPGPEQRAEPTAPVHTEPAPTEPVPTEPAPTAPVVPPVTTCGVTVDCDCPASMLVRGRRESTNCCELDCAAGEEIIETTADGGSHYRCLRCTH